jgi:hypothetical protein
MSTCMLAGCCVGGGEGSGVAVETGGSIYGVVADKAADGTLLGAISVGAGVDEGGDTAAEAENGTTVDAVGGGGVARLVFFGAAGAEAACDAMAASAGAVGAASGAADVADDSADSAKDARGAGAADVESCQGCW